MKQAGGERPDAARTAVLVLGMHRSGTSATAGLIALLGVQPPESLMPGNAFNAKGYWESSRLMAVHDRLLAAAGSAWDDWRPLDPDWLASDAARRFADEFAATLAAEFGNAPRIVVKDPRICRFVPLWRAALAAAGYAVRTVISVRDPEAVAASLAARNGFALAKSRLLWLRHGLAAEAATRDLPRLVVDYDTLVADGPGMAARIAAALGLAAPDAEAAAAIGTFVSEDLRHHGRSMGSGAEEDRPQVGWVAETAAALGSLARGGSEAVARARLDAVLEAFDRGVEAFGPLVTAARAEAEHHAVVRNAELAAARAAAAARARENRSLGEQLAAAEQARGDLAQRLAAAEQARGDLAQRLAAMERALAGLGAAHAALTASTSWRVTAPLRRLADRLRGRTPSPEGEVDPAFYLASNPDVAASGLDPEEHYQRYGRAEGRRPRPGR
jgi:hypothetical protein